MDYHGGTEAHRYDTGFYEIEEQDKLTEDGPRISFKPESCVKRHGIRV
jgi:hypothetical protein